MDTYGSHCLFIAAPGMTATLNNTQILVGILDRFEINSGQLVSPIQIIAHPNYDATTFENDIALIQLASPLVFNDFVMPIKYANYCNTAESDYFDGRNIIISGWGASENPLGTQFLRAVTMPIISRSQAMTMNLASTSINCTPNVSNNMLSFFAQGIAAGKGDSDGPAVMSKNGNDINIGVSSWGCPPKTQMPTIYTNVRNYSPWIEQVTGFTISKPGVDLYTRDRPWELGKEPSNVDFCWVSDDIWVRNQNDGQNNETHQNPIFHNTNPNYINIRVRNRGCLPSSGNDVLKVYWAKASTALAWPNHWNGSLNVNGQSLGNSIGEVLIPVVQPWVCGVPFGFQCSE